MKNKEIIRFEFLTLLKNLSFLFPSGRWERENSTRGIFRKIIYESEHAIENEDFDLLDEIIIPIGSFLFPSMTKRTDITFGSYKYEHDSNIFQHIE